MKLFVCLLLLSLFTPGFGQESDIDAFIEEVMTCADIPGLQLTVIRDNQDWLAKAYGVQDIDTGEPVTNETIFLLASTTKAFTGVAAAILLKNSEGIDFQTPIRDLLGEDFYLRDGTRSAQVQLRDVIAHRTGLPRNDEMRLAGWTKPEFVSRLQYLDYTYDFRDRYRYNNVMYSIAALVTEVVDGRTWQEFVTEEIYQPLGMVSSTFVTERDRWPDFSKAYYVNDNGQNRAVSLEVAEAYFTVTPTSGSVSTNAVDMRQWIKFQLNDGTTEDGTEILTTSEFRETHRALIQRTASPDFERPDDPVTFAPPSRYSLGWQETTYRDYEVHTHTGSQAGFRSQVLLVPSLNHGIYVGVNKSPDTFARDVITMYILDIIMGEDPWLDVSTVCDVMNSKYSTSNNMNKKKNKSVSNQKIVNENFIGTYGNHAYGTTSILEDFDTKELYIVFGRANFTWDLAPSDSDPNILTGPGRDPFWFNEIEVEFEVDGESPAVALTINTFDDEIPPRFERDLDLESPPAPPVPCV